MYLLHSQYWENSEICFHNNFYFHSVLGTELPLYDLAFKKCINTSFVVHGVVYVMYVPHELGKHVYSANNFHKCQLNKLG